MWKCYLCFAPTHNDVTYSFRDPEVFSKTCANLLARMIDTVPRGVQLTDVIEPMPVKPKNVHLVYTKDDTIHLNGDVRVSLFPFMAYFSEGLSED